MPETAPGRFYFSTDAVPARDRFAMYCEEIMRRYNGIDPATPDRARFRATLELRVAGSLGVAYGVTVAHDCVRTPGLVRDGDDALCFMLLERGSAYQGQCDKTQRPGDVVVCDNGYPGAYNFIADSSAWFVKLPRFRLDGLVPPNTRFAGAMLDGNPMARRLLFGYVSGTFNIDLRTGERSAQIQEDHIVDLIALALGADGDARHEAEQRGARAARQSAILHAIAKRSGEPGLSAAAVAASLGVTPRYVHLLLEETGRSFTHHLLEKRLEKAAALLRDPHWLGRRIADVADEAGFNDLSYFSRAFRRRYGMTASELRGTGGRI
jgi:AraC-like DNA-binding protein